MFLRKINLFHIQKSYMKILKYLFSIFIIIITFKVISDVSENLSLSIIEYIKLNFYFILVTIIFQFIGIYCVSLRWKLCVELFSNSNHLIFPFNNFLVLTARGLVLNNILPSILVGDLSKLLSPNKNKASKKQEALLIFFDRLIGLITLTNLGIISLLYLNFINYLTFYTIFFFEFLLFFIILSFKDRKVIIFTEKLKTLKFFKIIFISFISQSLFILSLLVQVIGLKKFTISFFDLFCSVFLNFVSIFPFSINGWGIREWSANTISDSKIISENLIASSIIYGLCFSISSLIVYIAMIFFIRKKKSH